MSQFLWLWQYLGFIPSLNTIQTQNQQMGNNICCEEQPRKQFAQEITVVHEHEATVTRLPQPQKPKNTRPEVSAAIQSYLDLQKPFEKYLPQDAEIIRFGDDVYEGSVDERGRPQGYGKMYKKNGSLFIGEFEAGIANGQGVYIKPNGSYYRGRMFKNTADDENGYYYSKEFEYRGGVKNNQFHGKAKQVGSDHSFTGEYEHNKKKTGVLIWKEGDKNFEYDGSFNVYGEFQGKGNLKTNNGEYHGDFSNGRKHGKGTFIFEKGVKYEGEYFRDVKQGKGKLINSDGSIAYEGMFKNGLPHGQGKSNKNGKLITTIWNEGIDEKFL